MSRIVSFALAAALTIVAVPAFAQTAASPTEQKDGWEKKFPMPAAEFRGHVAARVEKARARLEEHIADKKLTQEQADAIRAKFDAAVALVNAKVEEACADGTVTLDEARGVHELAKSLHPHHGQKPS